ncbi:YggN family protein [Bacillus sp. NP157]|nr:YggN family protein [Bacillus sp. NP157]
MRHPYAAAGLAAALALSAGSALAENFRFSTDSCNHDYSTPYDVDVTAAGLAFHRTNGTPSKVFLHDGALKVDGRDVAVSPADAASLRRYEEGVRKLLPEVAAVSRAGVQMGFDAMTTVTMTFAEPGQRDAMLAKLKRKQAQALREIDEGVGAGHWSSDRMTETVAGSVSDSVGELVGSVTSSAVSAALSGDSTQVAALTARANALDTSINREMNKRSKDLEARANGICPRLNELADLQMAWKVRTAEGKPLELMTIKPKDSKDDKDDDEDGKKVVMF